MARLNEHVHFITTSASSEDEICRATSERTGVHAHYRDVDCLLSGPYRTDSADCVRESLRHQ